MLRTIIPADQMKMAQGAEFRMANRSDINIEGDFDCVRAIALGIDRSDAVNFFSNVELPVGIASPDRSETTDFRSNAMKVKAISPGTKRRANTL